MNLPLPVYGMPMRSNALVPSVKLNATATDPAASKLRGADAARETAVSRVIFLTI